MASETISLYLGGDPTLDDLATGLGALRSMLSALATEAHVAQVTWSLDELIKSSALATFRGVGHHDDVTAVSANYLAVGRMLLERKPVPDRVARSADELLSLLDRSHLTEIRFETADDDVTLTREGSTTVAVVDVPRPPTAFGAVEGRVQTLSSRGGLHFTLFDLVHDRAVSCYLRSGMEETMRDAWGKVAVVKGVVNRDPATGRPRTIRDVESVEFVTEGRRGDWRLAEGALRGVGSEERPESTIRRLRDAQ